MKTNSLNVAEISIDDNRNSIKSIPKSSSWEVLEIIIDKEKRLISLINSWKFDLLASKNERKLDKKTNNYVYNFSLVSKLEDDKIIDFSLEFLPNDSKNQILNFEWKSKQVSIDESILKWIISKIYPLPVYTKTIENKVKSIISLDNDFLNK